MNYSKKIIGLASQSPRRKMLMEEAGFNIKLIPSPGKENYPHEIDVKEVAEYIAIQKSINALPYLDDLPIVLAADTVVIHRGQILGKPSDRENAIQTLHSLSGNKHQVITGVSILAPPFKSNFSVTTIVEMQNLSALEIESYVDKFQPYDKAGSYAIQEWIGLCRINHIEGSYTNVIGLPMSQVYDALKELIERIEI